MNPQLKQLLINVAAYVSVALVFLYFVYFACVMFVWDA